MPLRFGGRRPPLQPDAASLLSRVFLPSLVPNNLIFNNIDFRYRFAFNRYLHFFSITFPDSRFVVLQRKLDATSGVMPHSAVAAVSDRRTVGARHGVPLPISLGIGHCPLRRRRGYRLKGSGPCGARTFSADGGEPRTGRTGPRYGPRQAHFPRATGWQFPGHPPRRQRRIACQGKKNSRLEPSISYR